MCTPRQCESLPCRAEWPCCAFLGQGHSCFEVPTSASSMHLLDSGCTSSGLLAQPFLCISCLCSSGAVCAGYAVTWPRTPGLRGQRAGLSGCSASPSLGSPHLWGAAASGRGAPSSWHLAANAIWGQGQRWT